MRKTARIFGQPSWELTSDRVRLALTRQGGHMGPVIFKLGRREISPYSIAPWAEEKVPAELPPMLKALRGDFFCAPFGGNASAYRSEQHPPHGETANALWQWEKAIEDGRVTELQVSLKTQTRPGRVDKFLRLRRGETVVYSRHVLSGMSGPMCFGSHPMLRFPEGEGTGRISTSPLHRGWVLPEAFENPAEGGYQSLRPGAAFDRLDRVPTLDGKMADLTSYPARRGFEDLVLLVHEVAPDFAWSAVVFPAEGFVWFSLKDPRVLRSTILWHSDGGRHYAPWNGRHTGVLGVEDVTAYFHLGLAESARPNLLSRSGVPTKVILKPDRPLVVNTIQGIAAIPPGFQRVHSLRPTERGIRLADKGGRAVEVPLDFSFLHAA